MNNFINPYKNIKKKKLHDVEVLILNQGKSVTPIMLKKDEGQLILENIEGLKFYVNDFEKIKQEKITHYIEPNVTIFDEYGMPVIIITDEKIKLRYMGKELVQLIIDCLPEIKSFACVREEVIQEEIKWWDK